MSTDFQAAFDEEQTDDAEFKPLPEGEHVCTLLEVKQETNPFDQSPQTALTYQVRADQPYGGRRIWDTVKHDDKVAWKAASIHKGFSLEGKPTGWNEWFQGIRGCIGKACKVVVANRQGQDKVYTNVRRVRVHDDLPF